CELAEERTIGDGGDRELLARAPAVVGGDGALVHEDTVEEELDARGPVLRSLEAGPLRGEARGDPDRARRRAHRRREAIAEPAPAGSIHLWQRAARRRAGVLEARLGEPVGLDLQDPIAARAAPPVVRSGVAGDRDLLFVERPIAR